MKILSDIVLSDKVTSIHTEIIKKPVVKGK